MTAKADTFASLQKEILLLQGFKPASNEQTDWTGLEQIKSAFPNQVFPTGAVHEFVCEGLETVAASTGFINGVLSSLIQKTGVSIWISSSRIIFPPALKQFGLSPEHIIFIHLRKEKDKLFVMEEALKCDAITSVIGHINEVSFTESRRFQLAVEQSRVTAFLLRQFPKNMHTACVTRWKIQPQAGSKPAGLPGLGHPNWKVQLVKVRNGKPASWDLQWMSGRFVILPKFSYTLPEQERKII